MKVYILLEFGKINAKVLSVYSVKSDAVAALEKIEFRNAYLDRFSYGIKTKKVKGGL